ncbi:hypothetical protein MRS44_016793 [Fusarium solani]|uniref:uncharacterized protein n=1 Tax=Fusarium solani TaxID=169388 RepID=UPI0032C49567|nr:hypothetical protein MRS44_016793 [Fusarium solani]
MLNSQRLNFMPTRQKCWFVIVSDIYVGGGVAKGKKPVLNEFSVEDSGALQRAVCFWSGGDAGDEGGQGPSS